MEKKLTNNLWLKLLSILLAFFIWLAVMNVANPDEYDTREVMLEVLNGEVLEASGKTYELQTDKKTITVSYRYKALDAGSITSSDFRAYIDLADMYEPTGAVPVMVEVKNSRVISASSKPSVVHVKTEDLQRKPFDLQFKKEGTEEDGYRIGSPSLSPTYVYVNGPVSLVGQISEAGIVVNVDGKNSDLNGTAQVKCFDANGNVIPLDERVTLSRTEVDYSVPMLKTKNLALSFETEGRVAEGYRYTGIEASVNSVAVIGLKSDLAEVSTITIPKTELNMDGAYSDQKVTIDLNDYLPEGVRLAEPNHMVDVVIKVEPLEIRTFELPLEQVKQVGTSSRYIYEYEEDSIQVSIEGLKEDLDQIKEEELEAELDVTDLMPGISEGEITFQLGAAYEVADYTKPQIIVREKGPVSGSLDEDGEEAEGASEESGTKESDTKESNTKESAAKESISRTENHGE